MPLDGTTDDIVADLEMLDAIGDQVEAMIDTFVPGRAIDKTLRRWLMGHATPPEDGEDWTCLMALAADLELFTPSPSGRTLVDRHIRTSRPETPLEQRALDALAAAQLHLVRIVDRAGPDDVRVEDLATGESLLILDDRISPMATGLPTAMRLCRLASGRHALISPLFAMDQTTLQAAMKFVRLGHPLGVGHRCAANLYRDVARRGFMPMPLLEPELNADAVLDVMKSAVESLRPLARLAMRWLLTDEADTDLIGEARRLTSVDNLIDACGCYGRTDTFDGLRAAYERIAALQVETLAQRARAGVGGAAEALEHVGAVIAGHVADGAMAPAARELFDRLRLRWAYGGSTGPVSDKPSAQNDLDRVIQRIQALRAKTIDRGCTEEEAMAAAAKVSELLERHDLTLDEISIRRSDCEGVSVPTGRKRRAPVDSCVTSIAEFCDCRVWSEEGDDGTLRYVFFGLKADVAGARFLNELIETTFETESARFRTGGLYQALRGGDRRIALNSFQAGLANGIVGRLAALKAARTSNGARSTGFDLVAVKQSVVDEELAGLGLNFTKRTARSSRLLHGEAYRVGEIAGSQFEPHAALGE